MTPVEKRQRKSIEIYYRNLEHREDFPDEIPVEEHQDYGDLVKTAISEALHQEDEHPFFFRLEKNLRDQMEDYRAFIRLELVRFLSQFFENEEENYCFTGKTGYFRYLDQYFWNVSRDRKNANIEVRAYLEYRFNRDFDDIFEEIAPKQIITVNSGIWSFSRKSILPVWRYYTRNTPFREFKLRTEAFDQLGNFVEDYSTVWDTVANNIKSAFYFDQTPRELGVMEIYKFDLENRATPIHPMIIDARHRLESVDGAKQFKTLKTLEAFAAARENDQEMAYQKSVMRWFIRSGILKPEEANEIEGSRIGLVNLLLDKNEKETDDYELFQETLANQYNTYITTPSQEEDLALDRILDHILENRPKSFNNRIAIFESGFFNLTQQGNSISHIYWIPLVTNWRERIIGGTFYINSNLPLEEDPKFSKTTESEAQEVNCISMLQNDLEKAKRLEKLRRKLQLLTYYFSGLFDDKQIEELEAMASSENKRAAGVSIIARNISHNLGSHTLSYTKNKLSLEQRIIESGLLTGIFREGPGGTLELNEALIEQVKIRENATSAKRKHKITINRNALKTPYLKALGAFQGHLQERQDYIGSIAAGRKPYFGNINFNELIFNAFVRPDTENKGNGKEPTDDSVKLDKNILLEHIAFSEGYTREDIEINFSCLGSLRGKEKQLEVSMPSGILGRQGLFAIWENFIRNTAKHGIRKAKRPNRKLRIDIKIEDYNPASDYYRIRLCDNSGNTDEKIIHKIRESINSALITKDGRVNEDHKGIKEIQIAAAWLRNISPAEIENFSAKPPILSAEKVDQHLELTFYLLKPRKVLIISNKQHRGALPVGWKLIGSYNIQQNENLSYQFILFDKDLDLNQDEELRNQIKYTSVRRMLDYDVAGLFQRLEEFDNEKILALETELYKDWIDDKKLSHKIASSHKIAIIDEVGINGTKLGRNEIEKGLVEFHTTTSKNIKDAKIIFRTHNDNVPQFRAFQEGNKALYKQSVYIEGISGGNSTHRLLREERINEYWCHKMREVALTKILIIDERIWNNHTSFPSLAGKKAQLKDRLQTEHDKLDKKNIKVCTIQFEDQGTTQGFRIVDVSGNKFATIRKNGKVSTKANFHFISLHQGLLDKMVKFAQPEKESRKRITEDKSYQTVLDNFRSSLKADFQFIIHSGRSVDHKIPETVAFMELSSLDVALADSKYTLTQLLYSTILNKSID